MAILIKAANGSYFGTLVAFIIFPYTFRAFCNAVH